MTDGDTVYASPDRLYVASQRWLARTPRAARRRPSATGLHAFSTETAGEHGLPRQRRGPGLPAQPVVAVRARGRAAGGDDAMPPWEASAQAPRAPCARWRSATGGSCRSGSVGGLGRGERIYAVRFIGDTRLRRHVPPDRPAVHARPLRPARAAGGAASSRSPATRPTCIRSATDCCSASARTRRAEGRTHGRAAVALRRLRPRQRRRLLTRTPGSASTSSERRGRPPRVPVVGAASGSR